MFGNPALSGLRDRSGPRLALRIRQFQRLGQDERIQALWTAGLGLGLWSSPLFVGQRSIRRWSGSWASRPCGNTFCSTGMLRNGPETSTSESHSAW